ncbi:hypothetical protein Tco_1440605 [Tanacetum coccineum]
MLDPSPEFLLALGMFGDPGLPIVIVGQRIGIERTFLVLLFSTVMSTGWDIVEAVRMSWASFAKKNTNIAKSYISLDVPGMLSAEAKGHAAIGKCSIQDLVFVIQKLSEIGAKLRHVQESILTKLSSKWRFEKFPLNFKLKVVLFRGFFLVTLDGSGSTVCPLSPGFTSTPEVGIEKGTRIDVEKDAWLDLRLLVTRFWFCANDFDCWLGCCVAWEKRRGLDLRLPFVWRRYPEFHRLKFVRAACETYSWRSWNGDICYREVRASNHVFQFSNIGGDTRSNQRALLSKKFHCGGVQKDNIASRIHRWVLGAIFCHSYDYQPSYYGSINKLRMELVVVVVDVVEEPKTRQLEPNNQNTSLV